LAKRDRFLFTSESVTEGHPDKIADQISDAILDACLAQDPYSRVACETLTCTGLVVIAGEITTKAYVDFQSLVRGTVAAIGYDNALYGFDSNTCAVISTINKQSGDIAMGVDTGGAGDQGPVVGGHDGDPVGNGDAGGGQGVDDAASDQVAAAVDGVDVRVL